MDSTIQERLIDIQSDDETRIVVSYFIHTDRGAARIFLRGGLKSWKQKP